MDENFLKIVSGAVQAVFEKQVGVAVSAQAPRAKIPQDEVALELVAVIGLASQKLSGSLNLCLQKQVFLNVYEKMVGEKHTELIPDTIDAASELLNIIFGAAKTELNDKLGYSLEKAIPSVLVGENLKLFQKTRNPSVIIPFASSLGGFFLEVFIDKS